MNQHRSQASIQTERAASGFTLVEILVVIVIIGILAGIAIPAITGALRGCQRDCHSRLKSTSCHRRSKPTSLSMATTHPTFPIGMQWNVISAKRSQILITTNCGFSLSSRTTTAPWTEPRGNGHRRQIREARLELPLDLIIIRTRSIGLKHSCFVLAVSAAIRNIHSPDKAAHWCLSDGPAPAAEPDGDGDDYLFFQYNSERDTGYFDFDVTNLSLLLHENGQGPLNGIVSSFPYVYTTDEDHAGTNNGTGGMLPISDNALSLRYFADPFPTYHPPNSERPLVYFNSRDYDLAWGANTTTAWNSPPANNYQLQNIYLPSAASASFPDTGVARPYASNVVDTTPPTTIQGMPVQTTVLQFAEDKKFQIVSAGLDDNYGGIIAATWGGGSAGIGIYPSGGYYNPLSTTVFSVDKFQDDECLVKHYSGSQVYRSQPQLDNITNFTTRTFESDLP